MKLFVVRHAHAGSRSDWDQPDRARPLSDKGRRQAEGIAALLADEGIVQLVSSPAVRCVQTLEPLAARVGCPVQEDKRLLEGSSGEDALELVLDLDAAAAAICSHGDVIPDLLVALHLDGAGHKGPVHWAKASTWELKVERGRISKARYLPPPG